jgi:S-adenosylmethionine hydrolase
MTKSQPIITLLTDFGERDAYVGVMKGVILSILPDVQLVDISHQITPHDVHQAASILASAYVYYPAHTIHLAIVDPEVGSVRQPIALETPRGIFVAPDNGILTYIRLQEPSSTPVLLENSSYWLASRSNTFHGRDIFSPVAAHLANGVPVRQMGPILETIVMFPVTPLDITPTLIRGEVTQIDRFGNLLTNISRLRWLDAKTLELHHVRAQSNEPVTIQLSTTKVRITCGWHAFKGIHQTYSTVQVGQPLAVVGSNGELEIAINQGSASNALAAKVGDPVTLHIE